MNRPLRSFPQRSSCVPPLLPASAAIPALPQGPFTGPAASRVSSLQPVAKTSVDHQHRQRGGRPVFLTVRTGRSHSGDALFGRRHSSTSSPRPRTRRARPALGGVPPGLRANGFLFVDYTNLQRQYGHRALHVPRPTPTGRTRRRAILADDPAAYSNHKAGCSVRPDGDLYIGMGDGGSANDPECRAQDRACSRQILRIDRRPERRDSPYYGIPCSNPSAAPAIRWTSLGDRRAQPLGATPSTARTGDLWIGDVARPAERSELPAGVVARGEKLRLEDHGGHSLATPNAPCASRARL